MLSWGINGSLFHQSFSLKMFLMVLLLTLCEGNGQEEKKDESFEGDVFIHKYDERDGRLTHPQSKDNVGEDLYSVPKQVDQLAETLRRKVSDLLSHKGKVDVVFLIDASSSVGDKNFNSELKFVKKLLADFSVSLNETRVAVITFSDENKVVRHVDYISVPSEENNKCEMLHHAVPKINYSGGLTYTLGALIEAQSVLEWSRSGAQKAVFLITDGFSNGGDPVLVSEILKSNGTFVFTFGIKSGNIQELQSISSSPHEEFSFILDSFNQFEALARRALHQDLSVGSFQIVKNASLCEGLCPSTAKGHNTCCDVGASCSCGTHSGHFTCLCPPGYYGSGTFGSCFACPNGTFSIGNKPGDVSVCIPCPDPNHITVLGEATSQAKCTCKQGFVARGVGCEVITCPHLRPPENGYFVRGQGTCSNVFNAACGVRCKVGYTLHGTSIQLCQENGVWSGETPKCVVKMCPDVDIPKNGEVKCSLEVPKSNVLLNSAIQDRKTLAQQYAVDTECKFSCHPGHTLSGSRQRVCLPLGRWDGLRTLCKPVTCPPLPKLFHGSIVPEICSGTGKLSFGQKCDIICDSGFQLQGPSSRYCGGKGGQWSLKSNSSKCIDVEPPKITCPKDVVVPTDKGEAFATAVISEPVTSDNSGKPPVFWTIPSSSPHLKIPIGTNVITYVAMDPTHNQAFCNYNITVMDHEPPEIDSCVSPLPVHLLHTHGNATVTWTLPEFHDNSGKKVKLHSSHKFGVFPTGKTNVVVSGEDEAGNNSTCIIEIVVQDSPCHFHPSHAFVWCKDAGNVINCTVECHEGYGIASDIAIDREFFNISKNGSLYYSCFKDEGENQEGSAVPSYPECSEVMLPNAISQEVTFSVENNNEICDDVQLLNLVKGSIETQLAKSVLSFCNSSKISKDVDCLIQKVEMTCEEVLSTIEEDTNVIQQNRAKRDAKIETLPHSRINFSFNIMTELQKALEKASNTEEKLDLPISNGFQETLKQTRITLPPELKVHSYRWKDPDVLCDQGTVKSHGGRCVKCPSGYFYSIYLKKCQTCPIGEYQEIEGQLQCKSCPKNKSTKLNGSRSLHDCQYLCPPGTFGKAHVSTPQPLAMSACKSCAPGTYQPTYGATSCLDCPQNSPSVWKRSRSIDECYQLHQGKFQPTFSCNVQFCQNGGSCILSSLGHPKCMCPPSFYGSKCEISLNDCYSSPCLHGGTCVSQEPYGYKCICPPGFSGNSCEVDIDECAYQNRCLNNGKCEDLMNGFFCDCPDGFQGETCEENVNDCVNNPCGSYGICKDGVSNYSCLCTDGYSGRFCQTSPPDPCAEQSCVHGATCVKVSNDEFQCVCVQGWTGKQCDVPLKTSLSLPSASRNACVVSGNGQLSSSCQTRYNLSSDYVLHFTRSSVTNYAMLDTSLFNLSQITVCLWLQTVDDFNYGTVFSYATKSQFNTVTLTDYNGLVFYVNGARAVTDIVINDGLWHHICVLWEGSNGTWSVYVDGNHQDGGMGLSPNSIIPGSGKFVVGQDQDSFGGSFSEAESFVGSIFGLDMWDTLLAPRKMSALAAECEQESERSVVKWSDFLHGIQGDLKVENSPFCTECPTPESVWHGYVTLSKILNFTVATYTCDEGFVLHGSKMQTLLRRCLKQGSWEGKSPICVRRSCGFPGYLPGGTFHGRSYLYTDKITYECTSGLKISGDSTRTCESSGRWSGLQPTCKGQDCAPLIAPKNGKVQLKEQLLGTHAAYFSCNSGYHVDGADKLVCMFDGSWDEEPPECMRNACQMPPIFEHSYILNDSRHSYLYGDSVEYKCESGYEMKSLTSAIFQCGENGSWNPSNGSINVTELSLCCALQRYLEPELLHGTWIVNEKSKTGVITSGSVITCKCDHGYERIGPEIKERAPNGEWYPQDVTQCVKISCQTDDLPVNIPNSVIHLSGEELGDFFSITCKDGFQLVSVKSDTENFEIERKEFKLLSWTCQLNRTWQINFSDVGVFNLEDALIACISKPKHNIHQQCVKPQVRGYALKIMLSLSEHTSQAFEFQPPQNGYILNEPEISGNSSVGTVLGVRCRPGNILVGPSELKCHSSGTWEGLMSVRCKPIECPYIPNFPNMVVTSTSAVGLKMRFGNMLTLVCEQGFRPVGDLTVRCQSSGQWSPLRGKCITSKFN